MKDFIARQLGKRSTMKDFLHRNKVVVGAVMGGLSFYLHYSCPGLTSTICETLKTGSGLLSSFLIGAGALDSDYRQKFVQGVIIKSE
jgi:hypothetical protein